MRRFLSSLAIAVALAAPIVPMSVTPAVAQELEIVEILDALGYQTYAEHIEGLYRATPDDPTMDEGQRANWTKAAAGLFSSQDIIDAATLGLEDLTEVEIQVISEFYESDLAKTVTEMEVAVQDTARADEIEQAVDAYGETLPDLSPERLTLILELENAFGSADDTVAQVMNFQIGLMRGMADSNIGTAPLNEAEILLLVQSNADLIRAEIEESAGKWAGYTYRDLTDDQFATYLAFLQTDAAQRLYGLTDLAVLQIVERDAYRLGQIYGLLETSQEL